MQASTNTGDTELHTLLQVLGFVVSLFLTMWASEQRLRKWTEDRYLSKETADARYASIEQERAKTQQELERLGEETMTNALAMSDTKVLSRELTALRELEREHHQSNVETAQRNRSEILAAIESKFGMILDELRKMRPH